MLMSSNNDAINHSPVSMVAQLKPRSTIIECAPVPTMNMFAPLFTDALDDDDTVATVDDSIAEAEKVIDSYYDMIMPLASENPHPTCITESDSHASFQQQLRQYREKHKEKQNSAVTTKVDVLIVGDSIIKHISGPWLSRSKQVKMFCQTRCQDRRHPLD